MIVPTGSAASKVGNDRKVQVWVLVAFITTLGIGLLNSLVFFPAVSTSFELENYGDGWAQIAENVVRGNGFVYQSGKQSDFMTGQLKREPLYPLFLASILAVFGKLDPYMMLFQALINAMTSLVLYFMVSRIFNQRTGVIASLLYAVYPFAAWYVPRIAYETLLGLLIALLMLTLAGLFERPSFLRALAAGVMLGITVLCRGLYILLPLALVPALFVWG